MSGTSTREPKMQPSGISLFGVVVKSIVCVDPCFISMIVLSLCVGKTQKNTKYNIIQIYNVIYNTMMFI